MTDEEVGCYIRMLCMQWTRGGVDRQQVMRISSEATIDTVINEKFQQGDDGLYRNLRLEQVRETQQSRSKAGSKGGSKTQANVKQNSSKAQANDQAKLKPPSPSPSPSPNITHTHTPSEPTDFKQHKAVHRDWHELWHSWIDSWEGRMGKRFDPVLAQHQLYQLADLPPDKAAADLRFSIDKYAKSILDSDNDFSKHRSSGRDKSKKERVRL